MSETAMPVGAQEAEKSSKKRWFSLPKKDVLLTPTACILGIVVGLLLPGNADLSPGYRPISSMIGW